ncbi:MAG: ABC transporter substrate-binding protein, partial [Candidatus Cloacimonetes bacterium]|nr:ABC transporter substrate-binding protein [Candidatus Cloacimonadota bacterium]
SCCLLWDTQMEYTRLLTKYFKESYEACGGNIIAEDTFIGGTRDYGSNITRIKKLSPQPEMIYIAAGPDDIGHIVEQFRKAGVNQPIFGGDSYDTPAITNISEKLCTGIYYTTHFLADRDNTRTKKAQLFIDRYTKEYGSPPDGFAALGYDTTMLAADAIKRADSEEPCKILQALKGTRAFIGVSGRIIYRNNQQIPDKNVSVVAIIEGERILVDNLMPEKIPLP